MPPHSQPHSSVRALVVLVVATYMANPIGYPCCMPLGAGVPQNLAKSAGVVPAASAGTSCEGPNPAVECAVAGGLPALLEETLPASSSRGGATCANGIWCPFGEPVPVRCGYALCA